MRARPGVEAIALLAAASWVALPSCKNAATPHDAGAADAGADVGANDAGPGCVPGTSIVPTQVAVPSAAVVDVTRPPYNAVGDGVTDDTAAIQAAISANVATGYSPAADVVLYFPNGTYLVSAPLYWNTSPTSPAAACDGTCAAATCGSWGAYLSLQGESEAATIIKLKDSLPSYQTPLAPLPVIKTASTSGGTTAACSGTRDWVGNGEGATAFRNNLSDLTIDVGSGNPGAIGIDYVGNNQARIGDVTIKSDDGSGAIGLAMTRNWTGPALVKHLEVDGFTTGISVAQKLYSITMEHITLNDQTAAGIVNQDNVITVRDLRVTEVTTAVPAIANRGLAQVVVIDGTFTASSGATGDAVTNDAAGGATMYLRNVTATGYAEVVSGNGTTISEYASEPTLALFPGNDRSMDLCVQETPSFNDTNLAHWLAPSGNDAGAVQNAINNAAANGVTTVYLHGDYQFESSVEITDPVQRVVGIGAHVLPATGFTGPAFVAQNTANPLVIERIAFIGTFTPAIRDDASAPLVLLDLSDASYASGQPATGSLGPLYIEDVAFGPFAFTNQTVWARQLDAELDDPNHVAHVVNDGGTAWILDLKTEKDPHATTAPQTALRTRNGGATELLGGFLWIGSTDTGLQMSSSLPALVIDDGASSSFVYVTDVSSGFYNDITQTSGGDTKTLYGQPAGALTPMAYPRGLHGAAVPLFVGY